MKLPVYNQSGQESGQQIELNAAIFDIPEVRTDLVQLVAVAQRANSRQGTVSTKTRGEVRGGGRKPWKQKGTGRARVGSIRSPLWRGGGIIFGPRPERNFLKKVNKGTKRLGMFTVLTQKAQTGKIIILENLELEKPKTRELKDKLENFGKLLAAKKLLLVLPGRNENLVRAARNLASVKTIRADSLNVLDLLDADGVLILREAVPIIEKTYLGNAKSKG